MAEKKIARICWNTKGWREPSGRVGKSKNKKAFEYQTGFGHEEWLLDISRLISGWHFAYLQPIGVHHSKYVGKSFDISLYSINEYEKTRWWLGEVLNVVVITPEESKKAFDYYKRKGWLREMEDELRSRGAKVSEFRKIKPEGLAVVKFRPSNLRLLDMPVKFSGKDPAITATYYILLNRQLSPNFPKNPPPFGLIAGHRGRKSQPFPAMKSTRQKLISFITKSRHPCINNSAKGLGETGWVRKTSLPPEHVLT